MTTSTSDLPHDEPLAAGFAPASRAQWQALVDKVLAGADFRRRLVSRTMDGIEIEPLYTRDDALPGGAEARPGQAPFARGSALRSPQMPRRVPPGRCLPLPCPDRQPGPWQQWAPSSRL